MESEDELGEEKEQTEVLKRDPRGKPDLYIYFFSCRFLLTSLFPFPRPIIIKWENWRINCENFDIEQSLKLLSG